MRQIKKAAVIGVLGALLMSPLSALGEKHEDTRKAIKELIQRRIEQTKRDFYCGKEFLTFKGALLGTGRKAFFQSITIRKSTVYSLLVSSDTSFFMNTIHRQTGGTEQSRIYQLWSKEEYRRIIECLD